MAAKKKTTRILVSTVGGPAFRWVSRENISERYGRVGTSQGKPVVAKKRQVEVGGSIQKRAVSAKTIREKYRPAPGGIFYKPSVAKPAPKPAPKPAARAAIDIDEDIRRDAEGIEQDYNPPPPKPTTRQLPPQQGIMSDPSPQAEQQRLTGIQQAAVKKYRLLGVPPKEAPLIPTAQEEAESQQELGRVADEKDWVVIEHNDGVPVTDASGNPIVKDDGKPLTGKLDPRGIPAEKKTLLYEPVMVGGQQARDSEGHAVYRRKHGVVSREVPGPPAGASQIAGRQITETDRQLVIKVSITDSNGNQIKETYGFSHTIGGGTRLDSSYEARFAEAISSLKKRLIENGAAYENLDQAIIEAINANPNSVFFRDLVY